MCGLVALSTVPLSLAYAPEVHASAEASCATHASPIWMIPAISESSSGEPLLSVTTSRLGATNPIDITFTLMNASGVTVTTPVVAHDVQVGQRAGWRVPADLLSPGQTYHWAATTPNPVCSSDPAISTVDQNFVASSSPTPTGAVTMTLPASALSYATAGASAGSVDGGLRVGSDGSQIWSSGIAVNTSSIPANAEIVSAQLNLSRTACTSPCTSVTVSGADGSPLQTTGAAIAATADNTNTTTIPSNTAGIDITSVIAGMTGGQTDYAGITLTAPSGAGGETYATTGSVAPTVTVTYVPATAPTAPQDLKLEGGGGGIVAGWGSPLRTGSSDEGVTYTVTIKSGSTIVKSLTTSENYAIIDGLANNTSYSVSVAATNSIGAGASTSQSVTTQSAPPGGSSYKSAVTQLLTSEGKLDSGAAGNVANAASGSANTSMFVDELNRRSAEDLSINQNMAAASQQITQYQVTTGPAVAVYDAGADQVELYAGIDTTFTTIDSGGGSVENIPAEENAPVVFQFDNASSGPTITTQNSFGGLALPPEADTDMAGAADDTDNAQANAIATNADGSFTSAPVNLPADTQMTSDHRALSVSNAVSWAYTHWNGGPISSRYTHDDCTDFVSRVLNYGGKLPMVIPPHAVRDRTNYFWYYRGGEHYSNSWGFAPSLAAFLYHRGSLFRSYVSQTKVGDVAFVNWSGSSNINLNTINHAGFVTQVHGGNPYITQHSYSRKNEPIYWVTHKPSWWIGHPNMTIWIVRPQV